MAPTATLRSRSSLGNRLDIRVARTEGVWTCQPGQFFMLRAGESWSPYLRRALFPFRIDQTELGFLVQPAEDAGLAWLSAQPVGASLDLIGPLGNGFTLQDSQRRLLLVGEADSTAALLGLIQPALARQASVTLLLHARRTLDLLPAAALPPAVEYYTACDEPLPGQPVSLDTELQRALGWADLVCAAGSAAFLQRLKQLVNEVRFPPAGGLVQALAPVALPCGIGACLACLVDTGRGLHRACVRGPVFDLEHLAL